MDNRGVMELAATVIRVWLKFHLAFCVEVVIFTIMEIIAEGVRMPITGYLGLIALRMHTTWISIPHFSIRKVTPTRTTDSSSVASQNRSAIIHFAS